MPNKCSVVGCSVAPVAIMVIAVSNDDDPYIGSIVLAACAEHEAVVRADTTDGDKVRKIAEENLADVPHVDSKSVFH